LNKEKKLEIAQKMDFSSLSKTKLDDKYDFRYIIGQAHAKRAMEIARAG
jgi:predicted ATPase with chaperone activity